MSRVFNFSAGPATLPIEVLEQAQAELLDWNDSGMSVMEQSHRAKDFEKLAAESENDLRDLLKIPNNYKVLFVQGGGRGQFAMVPMNMLRNKKTADYMLTGVWSAAAAEEAKRYCQLGIVADSKSTHYTTIPERNAWHVNPDAAYFHYADNETMNGVEFPDAPEVGHVPLVSDMSSNMLSRPFDINKFALIYAGAQKNIGPAGLTIVIVREDYLGQALPITPTIFDYKIQADNGSLYQTPPTFAWYLSGLVFKWLKQRGGVEKIAEINQRKADKLYHCIDESGGFYTCSVDKAYRSRMNIIFNLCNESLDEKFVQEAKLNNLAQLKGHKLVGGMRASLYNALPEAGVNALVAFMNEFKRVNG